MKTVLLTDAIAPAGEELLGKSATVIHAPDSAPATIRALAREADGVIIRSKLPDDIFEAAPRLRAVVVHGTGTDLVPLESATAHGVVVANQSPRPFVLFLGMKHAASGRAPMKSPA